MATLPTVPTRRRDGHKGDYGHLLVVAGSRGMAGAAALTGLAALRSGAGLVTIACPDCIQDVVAATHPCLMTAGLKSDPHGGFHIDSVQGVERLAAKCDVIAIGPGLGRGPGVERITRHVLNRTTAAVVLDADALNALAPLNAILQQRQAPTVLTPHPGEFERLTSVKPVTAAERLDAARAFTHKHQCTLVLKGMNSVIADATNVAVNTTGNPGMATGGTGDVLTGVIAALLGQKLTAFDAAVLGAHVHGLAGDLAAQVQGEVSLTAVDVIEALPAAFQSLIKVT
jgi:NAD(P)H-hydrate epimerase